MQEFKGKASTSFHRGIVDRVVCPADMDFYATCSRDSTLRHELLAAAWGRDSPQVSACVDLVARRSSASSLEPC